MPRPHPLRTLLLSLCLLGCERVAAPVAPAASAAALSPDRPAADTQLSSRDEPRVVFLGDSITAGFQLSADEAFPALLAARFRAEGRPIRVANAGVSGDTSAGGLRRVDWILKQEPDVVVVELGGNDGLRGAKLTDIEQNLRALLRKLQAAHVKVLLLGMLLPPSEGEAYTRGFAELYPRLASELAVPLVPTFMLAVAGKPSLNLADGLHPNPAGQQALADTLAAPLAALLDTLAPPAH